MARDRFNKTALSLINAAMMLAHQGRKQKPYPPREIIGSVEHRLPPRNGERKTKSVAIFYVDHVDNSRTYGAKGKREAARRLSKMQASLVAAA